MLEHRMMPATLFHPETASPDVWQDELVGRRQKVDSILQERGIDVCLAYGSRGFAEQFRYLANFEPLFDGWLILPVQGQPRGIVHALQLEDAARFSGLHWEGDRDPLGLLLDALQETDAQTIGTIGTGRIPGVALDALRVRLPHSRFVDLDSELETLRRTKSPLELAAIREAARIADIALESTLQTLRPGLTENQISARIACTVQEMNAVCTLVPFVLSGNDNPTTHRDPSGKVVEAGETVMIDFLVAVNGYHADIARSVVLGIPSTTQRRAWNAVRDAHAAILRALAPGVPCSTLQSAAVATLEGHGFTHPSRVGHGLGLGHSFEWPGLDSDALLEPGMAICFEPRVNEPGTGAVKIEDDVLITEVGYELLTHTRRQFVVDV